VQVTFRVHCAGDIWWAKCLFSYSDVCSLLSGSLALEAFLIGVHCKKRYINVWIQYNFWVLFVQF